MKKLYFLILGVLFIACSENNNGNSEYVFEPKEGVFILNEGTFNQQNASIGFYSFQEDSLYSNLFEKINNRPLGDVLQSYYFHNGELYFLVNNSGKIEVVDPADMTHLRTIDDLLSPRHMVIEEERGYVSNLFGDVIQVVNPFSSEILESIPTEGWTEDLFLYGNALIASRPANGDIIFIDLNSLSITDSLETGSTPGPIVQDAFNDLWVLNRGSAFSTPPQSASLVRFDPETRSLIDNIDLEVPSGFASRMDITGDGRAIYILHNKLLKVEVNDNTATIEEVNQVETSHGYGLGVQPSAERILIGTAPDFSSQGVVYLYRNLQLIDSFTSGVAPNEFFFY